MSAFGVDPTIPGELKDLGVAVGVLEPPDGDSLRTDWFTEPAAFLAAMLKNPEQRDALIDFAERMLGTIRDELDLPDIPEDETWIRLVGTGDGNGSGGLFAVLELTDDNALHLSLGARAAVESGADPDNPELVSAVTLRLPLLELQPSELVSEAAVSGVPVNSAATFLIGTADGTVELAASVTLPGGLQTPGSLVELGGASIAVALPTDGGEPSLSVVLRDLVLPGDAEPRDVAIGELVDSFDQTLIRLFLALLEAQAANLSDEVRHLLALLGLHETPPIPTLPIGDVLSRGAPALRDWFRQLTSNVAAIQAWLDELRQMLGFTEAVAGSGTPDDPYRICETDGELTACLTLVVESDSTTGVPVVRPGARVTADAPADEPVEGRAVGVIEFAKVTLGPDLTVEPLPRLEVYLELGTGSDPLVDRTVDGVVVRVGQLRLGLRLNDERRPEPVVEARDVDIGSDTYEVLDLTSAEAVQEAATGALEQIIDRLLEDLGIESNPEAHALAALAGFTRPAGVADTDPWPDLVTLPEFFADPGGAVACYHVRVLAVPGAWAQIAAELGVLLKAAGTEPPAVTGSGTEADPWTLLLFDNRSSTDPVRGRVDLLLWSRPPATFGPTLQLALRTRPLIPPLDEATLTVAYTLELLQVALPAETACPAPPELIWAPCHTVRGRLEEDLSLTIGAVTLLADTIEGSVRWCRDNEELQGAAEVTNPQLEIDGDIAALPPISFDFSGGFPDIDLGEIPWPHIEALFGDWLSGGGDDWLPRLGGLLGWLPSLGDLTITLPRLPELTLTLPSASWPKLSLEDLFGNPFDAIIDWLRSLFSGGGGGFPDFSLPSLGWLSALIPSFGNGDGLGPLEAVEVAVTGSGTYDDPWAVRIGGDPQVPELLLWLDPEGPSLAGFADLAGHLLPDDLTGPLDGSGDPPDIDRLAEFLERASSLVPELDRAIRGIDLPAALTALRTRILDGDGLVLAEDQDVDGLGPAVELSPTAHILEPAAFDAGVHLPADAPSDDHRIFVSAPLPGVRPWPGETDEQVIDLTQPGVRPEALDLSAISATGPWFIKLPSRADAAVTEEPALEGLEAVVGRLRRGVAAVRERLDGDEVAVIAHSVAGHAARILAAEPGISHLVTIGTPHGGATFEFLDGPETGEALRLLQRLRGLIDDAVAEAPDVKPLSDLIETLSGALDEYAPDDAGVLSFIPFPFADFTAPAYPDLHSDTTARAVIGRVTPDDLDRALASLIRRVLEKAVDLLPGGEGHTVTHLGIGVRAPLSAEGAVEGDLDIQGRLRLDLHRVELQPGGEDRAIPRATTQVELQRIGGWLVGGPNPSHEAGTPRDPRVRRAEIEVITDFNPLDVSARIVLYDASVFGVERGRWVIDETAVDGVADGPTQLLPEARVLLGELVREAGPLPATGSVRRFFDLLQALALVEIDEDDDASLIPDPIEGFLVDPLAELRARTAEATPTREQVLDAVRDWLGATDVPGPDRGFAKVLDLVGLELDPAEPASVQLTIGEDGLTLGGVVNVRGFVRVDTSGHHTGELRFSSTADPSPAGRPALVLAIDSEADDPFIVRLEIEDSSLVFLPASIRLFPDPELDQLADHLFAYLPGELLRIALEWARERRQAALDELTRVLGLRVSRNGSLEDRLRNPAGLLADPQRWLTHPDVLGPLVGEGEEAVPALRPERLQQLIDAFKSLFETSGSPGVLPLPWDVELRVTPGPDGVVIAVGWTTPVASDAVRLSGRVQLEIGRELTITPTVEASVRLESLAGLDHAELELAFDGTARVRVRLQPSGEAEIVLTLLPEAAGFDALADLAGASVQHILPLVLEALTSVSDGDVGDAIESLGDALNLRSGGRFDANQLRTLAGDPAAEVVTRLRSNAADALSALRDLADSVMETARITVSGDTISVTPIDDVTVELTVPSIGPVRLCVEVSDVEPVEGLDVGGRVCATSGGLEGLRLSVAVTGASLLEIESISLLPFASLLIGTEAGPPGDRVEVGIWTKPPGEVDRMAIVVRTPFSGDPDVVCREADGTDSAALRPCAIAAVRTWLIPLLLELITAAQPVVDRLKQKIKDDDGTETDETIGDLLDESEILQKTGPADDPAYDLRDGLLDNLRERILKLGIKIAEKLSEDVSPDLGPVRIVFASVDDDGRKYYGVRIERGDDPELFTAGPIRAVLRADTDWIGDGVEREPGLELLLVSVDESGGELDFSTSSFDPWIRAKGVGLRVEDGGGGALIDLVASVEAIELYGLYDRKLDDTGNGLEAAGGSLRLANLTIPIGRTSSGDNPVAAKLLSQGNESSPSGDDEELAPAFSPELILLYDGDSDAVDLTFRAAAGDGPWWIPIQQSFGPIYVEQVGMDTEEEDGELENVIVLLDGGVSLAGLVVGLDDLSVTIPWERPYDLAGWRLGLAGLAVGYQGGGVSLAGGLREFRDPEDPEQFDYRGMLLVRAVEFELNAIGAYGEFEVAPGSSETYTSLFVFVAVGYPIGGPPPFFITGLGGGVGLNRRLVLPAEVTDVPSFPLVAAMDPDSPFAQDPMGALDDLGETFPPRRGTFWFAAGVRFTTFALVESVAVLSVEVADGVEVALLGLSRMDLPTPAKPLARVELALRGRFSSREAILAIEAQLTDNSWILNENCRLTGGFAYVVFFREGQFVLTLGGYHPNFARPDEFPIVPRLGFNWSVSNAVTIKGESYFALTSTCVMAGGRLEASYRAGIVRASFVAGADFLVSWDPFYYEATIYVRVSAGVRIKKCLFGACVRINISISIGAEVQIEGPKLRGRATLDLEVTSVTVRFGPSSAPTSNSEIPWSEFLDKYLIQGDEEGLLMGASVLEGLLTPEPATGADDEPDTGRIDRPWRVMPEFVMVTETRVASNRVNSETLTDQPPIDLGPRKVTGVSSTHSVTVTRATDAGVPLADDDSDVTSDLEIEATLANVPEGVWRFVPRGERIPEANVRLAFVGARIIAFPFIPDDDVKVSLDGIEISDVPHPLPFHHEITQRTDFFGDVEDANTYVDAQPTGTVEILEAAAEKTGIAGRLAARAFIGDRVAPPRLAPLADGMVAPKKDPVPVTEIEPPPPPPPPDISIRPPRLRGVLRDSPAPDIRAKQRTKAPAQLSDLPRVAAPTLAAARASVAALGPARLELTTPAALTAGDTVRSADEAPGTGRAGGALESRRGLATPEPVAASIAEIEAGLLEGVSLLPGDVLVWELPNAHMDLGAERPALNVKGDQLTRITILDRAGDVMLDRTGSSYEVEVPRGAHRLAVAGLGRRDPAATEGQGHGIAGWHAAARLARISSDVLLAPDAVIRTGAARQTLRERQTVNIARVRAADAVVGPIAVSTRLPPNVRTVIVVLEMVRPEIEVEAENLGLVLGLEGAQRPSANGRKPGPTTSVITGRRLYALFDVEPEEEASAITVTVASDERFELGGVLGTTTSPEAVEEQITEQNLESMAARLTGSPLGESVLTWMPAPEVE